MTAEEIHAAADLLAERFREVEDYELVAYTSRAHRDAEIVRWVIRCLANSGNGHGALLDTVWERRYRVGTVAS